MAKIKTNYKWVINNQNWILIWQDSQGNFNIWDLREKKLLEIENFRNSENYVGSNNDKQSTGSLVRFAATGRHTYSCSTSVERCGSVGEYLSRAAEKYWMDCLTNTIWLRNSCFTLQHPRHFADSHYYGYNTGKNTRELWLQLSNIMLPWPFECCQMDGWKIWIMLQKLLWRRN